MTSCLGTALWANVFGRFGRRSLRVGSVTAESDTATRNARPCLPVKPLDMIWSFKARSVKHREQRRREASPVRYVLGNWPGIKVSEPGVDAASLAVLSVLCCDAFESVLDFLLRNFKDGTR